MPVKNREVERDAADGPAGSSPRKPAREATVKYGSTRTSSKENHARELANRWRRTPTSSSSETPTPTISRPCRKPPKQKGKSDMTKRPELCYSMMINWDPTNLTSVSLFVFPSSVTVPKLHGATWEEAVADGRKERCMESFAGWTHGRPSNDPLPEPHTLPTAEGNFAPNPFESTDLVAEIERMREFAAEYGDDPPPLPLSRRRRRPASDAADGKAGVRCPRRSGS